MPRERLSFKRNRMTILYGHVVSMPHVAVHGRGSMLMSFASYLVTCFWLFQDLLENIESNRTRFY